jgi:hypothetical protein
VTVRLPPSLQAITGPDGKIDPNWQRWLAELVRAVNTPAATTTPTVADPVSLVQGYGIAITGTGATDSPWIVRLREIGDSGAGTFKLVTIDSYGRVEGSEDGTAADIPYPNTDSGLDAENVKAAIDELAAEKVDDAPSDGSEYVRKNAAWAVATASTGMQLVGTATVAGSAATDLTLSGLDLASDGRYVLEYNFLNATASQAVISILFNADATATNYDNENVQANGSATTAARANAPTVGVLNASSTVIGQATIRSDRNGKPSVEWRMRTGETTTITERHGVTMWRTAANVTSITLSSSVASALSVGDYFKVWKVGG